MKKKHFRFLSLAFFLIGIFFLLNSKTDITGAVVGVSNSSFGFSSIFGIVFILVSAMLFVGGEWVSKESLEDIVSNKVSKTKLKSIQYLGQQHIKKGKGDVYSITREEEKLKGAYRDIFLCIEMEKHSTPEINKEIAIKYHKENNRIFDGLEDEGKLTSYDAKSLDSGRGKYRFMFKDEKYLGLAIHTKSAGGKYRYRWV